MDAPNPTTDAATKQQSSAMAILRRLSNKHLPPPTNLKAVGPRQAIRGRRHSYDDGQIKGLRAVFEMFDGASTGGIPVACLHALLTKLGVNPTEDQLAHARQEFDVDGNGVIDFEEFLDMVSQLRVSCTGL